jgi:hypothetical protein
MSKKNESETALKVKGENDEEELRRNFEAN